ncbi:thiamine pyrophosphate-dependent dehydrogenase E1 component subunit alpha [Sphingomonas sp.]|uniref:thiamine pyrophosphate-dependent dehydrogenase E1 component subunit alpha n=1 Tax=Sphingomonas sp. TaxID=28214 RepID=UPI003B005B45
MTVIKRNDDRFIAELRAGRLSMPYYSARGQECIPAAVSVNLNHDDYVVTIYRGVHDLLGKGVPPKLLWAEIAGKATGTCKGKGGPMHITHPASGCMVTTGVVGASMPIACGLGLASQIRGDGRVTIANFGDGASNIGAFHESLNLAAVWQLPVIFVCQNNLYAEHTPLRTGTAIERIADRAASYSIPGVRVDGNDPVAVHGAVREAIARARAGDGPTLIEAVTFRFNGHVIGDSGDYIPKEEFARAKAEDPYPRFRALLIEQGHADAATLDAMDAEIAAEVEEAVLFARESPFPEVVELERDVYGEARA